LFGYKCKIEMARWQEQATRFCSVLDILFTFVPKRREEEWTKQTDASGARVRRFTKR
jgi:hypothetical protein